jgi:hypothetical protein
MGRNRSFAQGLITRGLRFGDRSLAGAVPGYDGPSGSVQVVEDSSVGVVAHSDE